MDSWLTKIRSFFSGTQTEDERPPEVESRLYAFESELGVTFHNRDLLAQALTHRSFLGCTGGDPNLSNERMEFLGDAVLELIVIEFLYRMYPDDREGALTKRKGLLVSRKVLASSADWMRLGEFILLSDAERESGGTARSSILADTMEAVIGAIYLDQGLPGARDFVENRLLVHADRIFKDLSKANFKSQLQEHVQAQFKTHPRYRVVTEVGPDHRKLFTVEVMVRGRLLGRGQGYNKKEAQQSAARNAMLRLKREASREKIGEDAGAEFESSGADSTSPPESVPTIPNSVPASASPSSASQDDAAASSVPSNAPTPAAADPSSTPPTPVDPSSTRPSHEPPKSRSNVAASALSPSPTSPSAGIPPGDHRV